MGGNPTGPMQYGRPEDLRLETDPRLVQGAPDLTNQRGALKQSIAEQQGNANRGAMAALQSQGVGGSEATNALGNIAGDAALKSAQGMAGIEQQDFNNKKSLMDAINDARMSKYKVDSGNFNQENQDRAGAVGAGTNALMRALAAYYTMGGSEVANAAASQGKG